MSATEGERIRWCTEHRSRAVMGNEHCGFWHLRCPTGREDYCHIVPKVLVDPDAEDPRRITDEELAAMREWWDSTPTDRRSEVGMIAAVKAILARNPEPDPDPDAELVEVMADALWATGAIGARATGFPDRLARIALAVVREWEQDR